MSRPSRTRPSACGHRDCGISTGYFYDSLTFGRGELDFYGYWEIPCEPCARRYEEEHPGEQAWPLADAPEPH